MRFLGVVLLVACTLRSPTARAHDFSPYEAESIRFALEEVDGQLDPEPEGKWIEGIDVVTLEVFEERDPLPGFLNFFHTTSRRHVVEREVLLRPGERYSQELVEESERNLRVRQLSVVLIVPIRGSSKDRVRLLVVTKDVWSLRVNFEPVIVNGRLQSLFLQPSEENIFGLQKILNANISVGRSTYSVGLGFVDPRIAGSRLQARGSASLLFNCETGDSEGSTGYFSYGKPLHSLRTRWGWNASVSWADQVVRPAGSVGDSICQGGGAVPIDFLSTREVERIPYQYWQDTLVGSFSGTRSFGVDTKQDLSFGLEGYRRDYMAPEALGAAVPEIRAQFEELVPVGDRRMSPFVQLHAYEPRFHRVLDFETLGLQEDYLLGYDLWLKAYPAARDVGSSRTLFGTFGGAGYTVPLGSGLARAWVSSNAELASGEGTDVEVRGGARMVSPRLPFGRVLVDGLVVSRVVNYLNLLEGLGGTDRLRGYRTASFVGPNKVVGNLEIRSRPVSILSVEVGAVAFYDVGDAYREGEEPLFHHGAGGGLRFVFPQVERTVFRIDVGFPLGPADPAAETTVVAQFRQAFPMTQLTPPSIVPQ